MTMHTSRSPGSNRRLLFMTPNANRGSTLIVARSCVISFRRCTKRFTVDGTSANPRTLVLEPGTKLLKTLLHLGVVIEVAHGPDHSPDPPHSTRVEPDSALFPGYIRAPSRQSPSPATGFRRTRDLPPGTFPTNPDWLASCHPRGAAPQLGTGRTEGSWCAVLRGSRPRAQIHLRASLDVLGNPLSTRPAPIQY